MAFRFRFRRTKQPQPGTMAYAFLRAVTDPAYPLSGPSIGVRHKMSVLQPQQLMYVQRQTITGLGGLVAGVTALQPLVIPEGNQ